MIIKDLLGAEYAIRETRMQVIPGDITSNEWVIEFDDVRKHAGRSAQLWMNGRGPDRYCRVAIGNNAVGCRTFSPATFAKILKAAGIKPKPVRKTNKRKVAR